MASGLLQHQKIEPRGVTTVRSILVSGHQVDRLLSQGKWLALGGMDLLYKFTGRCRSRLSGLEKGMESGLGSKE